MKPTHNAYYKQEQLMRSSAQTTQVRSFGWLSKKLWREFPHACTLMGISVHVQIHWDFGTTNQKLTYTSTTARHSAVSTPLSGPQSSYPQFSKYTECCCEILSQLTLVIVTESQSPTCTWHSRHSRHCWWKKTSRVPDKWKVKNNGGSTEMTVHSI